MALGAAVSFTDDPLTIGVTVVKAQHITELRQVVNAVRSLAGLSAATWTNTTLTAGVTVISADDVRDLRSKLDEALVALAIQTSSYTDPTLATGQNGTLIKKTHITQLRERTSSGSGATGSGGSSGGVQYVLSDVQGSSRAVMNNNGVGTSTISARHDYLPFGQEIGSGIGLRTGTQGYSASDTNRQKYALTERDDTTGLDHTWWRKYENTSGRWTSPDPLGGSMSNPQSFNRYSYVQNDPVNNTDPTGLFCPAGGCPPDPEPQPDYSGLWSLFWGGMGRNLPQPEVLPQNPVVPPGFDKALGPPPSLKLPGCIVDISITNNNLLDGKQLQAMKNEISRIFATGGQEINFVSSNASYYLNVNAHGANYTNNPTAVGLTPLNGSAVTDNGRVFVDRLTASATSDSGATAFNQNSNALAIGLGRAGSHEISHYLLQQNYDSSKISGVMHAGFKGSQWFSTSAEGMWKFTPAQIKQLNSLCGR